MRCVGVVDRLVARGEFGGLEFHLPLCERRQRPVENAGSQQRSLDGVGRFSGVDHLLDRLQQKGEVRIMRLGAFVESRRQNLVFPFELDGDSRPFDQLGKHDDVPL